MNKHRLVIVGGGMVGGRLVEDLVALDATDRYEVTVFGEEPGGSYNRILLSGVLAGSHRPEDLAIHPPGWYAEKGVRFRTGTRVAAIDPARHRVQAEGGLVEPYDRLVLATGSRALLPPLPGLRTAAGALRPGAFAFRTLEDCAGMLAYARGARRAVVVGGGLLGLEAARGLLARGLEVHVVHLMDHLMEIQLDAPAGGVLQTALEALGLVVHLSRETVGVPGEGPVEGVAFRDGSTLPCDMLVVAIGIRPRIELAEAAGLAVRRGILVGDDLGCLDTPDVYAVGECAEHRGRTYGLVAPLWDQSRVLAERLAGRASTYQGSRVHTRLKVAGVDLAVLGDSHPGQAGDELVTYSEPARGQYRKVVLREGRVAGAILLGDTRSLPGLLQAFERGTPAPELRSELLFPAADAGPPAVEALPDEAQVCNCNGVAKGAIVAAVRAGARRLATVCERTRAGTGCGSCRPQVQALLEWAAGQAPPEDPSIHYYVPGVPLAKAELVASIRAQGLKSVSSVFAALAGGHEDAASKPGLASLLRGLWGREYQDERDARFINDRVHANIQNDGTFSVVPRIYGGVTSPAQLRRIADVAERHGARMVKITGGQRLDLLGIPKERLPQVWEELGMPSGHAYSKAVRTCKTCVGTEFCRYGLGDSIGLGIAIERRFQGLEAPHKIKLATAGCPRNCSEATTKDLGAVAVEGGRWELYVGGAAGSRVRKGDLLCTLDTHEEVLRIMGRFIQYYREHARYQERSYDFVARVGIERLRAVLVEDAEGLCARLDGEVSAAVGSQVDPWEEARRPVHPTQFAGPLLPAARLVRSRVGG